DASASPRYARVTTKPRAPPPGPGPPPCGPGPPAGTSPPRDRTTTGSGADLLDEPGRLATAARVRRPGQRPRQADEVPGPRDPDVQQPPLLLDRVVGLRVHDRHHAVGEPGQEHHVPLQPLGRVQRR